MNGKLAYIILSMLKGKRTTDDVLEDLSSAQSNLLTNYSNPVFNSSDKNKLMQIYGDVKNVGEKLYRYKVLKENNMQNEADKEVSNLVLKGGVSYNKYVWHAEGNNPCSECAALDGTVYEWDEEVSSRPHPNCQCTVEVVPETESEEEIPQEYPSEQETEPIIINGTNGENEDNKETPNENKSSDDAGVILSASADVTEFLKRLGEDIQLSKKDIKKILYETKATVGRRLENKYKNELYLQIEKIVRECVDGVKAAKIAGRIAGRVAPILTVAEIIKKTIDSCKEDGIINGAITAVVLFVESRVSSIIFEVLVDTVGVPIVYSVSIILVSIAIKDYIMKVFKQDFFN